MHKLATLITAVALATGPSVAAQAHGHHENDICKNPGSSYALGKAAYYWFHWQQPLSDFPSFGSLSAAEQTSWKHAGVHVVWKACHPTQSAPWPETLPVN